MSYIRIGGTYIDVNVREELSEFDWVKPRWTSEKLIAASPFRYDNTPSFFVNLDGEYAGTFADSGAYDADYESGNLVKLLAFLRSETYEETVEYLHHKYGLIDLSDDFKIPIPTIRKERKKIVLDSKELTKYTERHSYLRNRGIDEKVEAFFQTRYSKYARAVIIPWHHPNGDLANMKFRKIQGKAFWYRRNAHPIRGLVYGLNKVYKHEITEVELCEAEIDALSMWSIKRPAIALGSASISRTQVEAIRKSPIERLIISTDSDKAGEKVAEQVRQAFPELELYRRELPAGIKDVNEALVKGVLHPESLRPLPRWERLSVGR